MASQAGLFSAVLTAFVVDSKQELKPSPADETVYYLQQHSTILSQISLQLSSLAPQVPIPSTPPPSFPDSAFKPSASDVRVNVFWFMALVFSLLAALLAILVQQWVRKHMNVFERYGDPLKSSRLRQYLHEGSEKWHMPTVAEGVPLFLHISLFLFFIGLGDSLLNINTKVALSTIVPTGISGLLYILITFVPIIYPQSPYQNSFSDIFWYLFQKLHCRRFRDRGHSGEMKPVSTNMAHGQMQLAMEETKARKGRDVQAIRWMIGNMTEDAEMEKFLSAIPGSFNTEWGTEVWRMVGKDKSQPSSWSIRRVLGPIIHLFRKSAPPDVPPNSTTAHIHELSMRVAHSVEICKNRNLFANDDSLWRKRTRACIEATASLTCCANAKLSWFGGVLPLLGEIGRAEHIRRLSLKGTDQLFVMRWTCLSLMAIRPVLEDNLDVRRWAKETMELFAGAYDNNDALECAQKIDETLHQTNNILSQIYRTLRNLKTEDLIEVEEALHDHKSQISELKRINIEAERLEDVDWSIFKMQDAINIYSHQITSQTPGVLDDVDLEQFSFSYVVQLPHDTRKLQFIRPMQTLKGMCRPAMILDDILEGKGDAHAYKKLLKNLEKLSSSGWQGDEMQRKLWRLQDLDNGGGLGFRVELFFFALSQLLSTSSSHSALYTGTFRSITSGWNKHKTSLGTQNLLLDIAMSRRGDFSIHYPVYIVDEFLLLLGKIFKGRRGEHINKAREQFESFVSLGGRRYRERVLSVLTEGQSQSLPVAS